MVNNLINKKKEFVIQTDRKVILSDANDILIMRKERNRKFQVYLVTCNSYGCHI
jgi:hypothetical protein